MKLGIIDSAFSQVGMDTVTGFQHIARIGFDCVDVFPVALTCRPKRRRRISPYLQASKDLTMDGVISIELEYSPDPARIVERVEEVYRGMDRLMRLNGLRGDSDTGG